MCIQTSLCECGCGGPAPVAHQTDTKRGYVKGQPRRFIQGHNTPKVDARVRFWSKVLIGAEQECWEWQGALYGNRYGHFALSKTNGVLAHRYAYELTHGPIESGKSVRHSCDNPRCVNPGHLLSGTQSENMQDMHSRGRYHSPPRHGEHGAHKLTQTQVDDIRRSTDSVRVLSARYNVCETSIRNVRKGKTWTH